MNVLDLFSGIGGFSLGLERAGMRTLAFCEIDPYCQAVLRQHWPAVPIWGDVRTLTSEALANAKSRTREFQPGEWEDLRDKPSINGASRFIDLICGGFPCQDISIAGKGAGIEGQCSGLWKEFARIISEVRPRYVIVENVAALLGRGIERVLGDLAALGYDAEWHCIPAAVVGAPHRRDRVWIVAYSDRARQLQSERVQQDKRGWIGDGSEDVADTKREQRNGLMDCYGGWPKLTNGDWWFAEPDVGRVVHGVPFRVDRLRSLGNAIVPQIAEVIGKAIMAHELSA